MIYWFFLYRFEVLCLAFGHWVKCYQFRWREVRLLLTSYPSIAYQILASKCLESSIHTEDDVLIIFCTDIIRYCRRHFGAGWSFERYSSATSRCCIPHKGHSLPSIALLTDAYVFYSSKTLYIITYIMYVLFYFWVVCISIK